MVAESEVEYEMTIYTKKNTVAELKGIAKELGLTINGKSMNCSEESVIVKMRQ